MAPLLARRSAPSRTLERLYRHHASDVYRTALALLRNPQEAEDATQTAFLNAYRALMRGEKPREPRSWMLAIVHNVVRMRHRTLSRRPSEVPLEERHEPAAAETLVDLEPVLEALARLPLNQRAAIVMREVEGRTYAEIASVLGVTVSSVEALIFRARRNLRMNREALGVLSVAPVPASLLTASGVGGGVAAVVASDIALKAAAVVVAGIVVGGAAIHGDGHASAGTDRRPEPALYRPAPASAAATRTIAVVRAAPPRKAVRHRASAAPVTLPVLVASVPTHPAAAPALRHPHRRLVPMIPRSAPPAAPPAADPSPKSPPAGPPSQPPAEPTDPTSTIPVIDPLPIATPALPALPPVEAPRLPVLPAAPPVTLPTLLPLP
jgi:RNA polymerase sigma factor (sigma-70 family)